MEQNRTERARKGRRGRKTIDRQTERQTQTGFQICTEMITNKECIDDEKNAVLVFPEGERLQQLRESGEERRREKKGKEGR
jgi:hypothetical protein